MNNHTCIIVFSLFAVISYCGCTTYLCDDLENRYNLNHDYTSVELLYEAIQNDNPDIITTELLVSATESDPTQEDDVVTFGSYANGWLYVCAYKNAEKCAKKFLELGANPMIPTSRGETLFQRIHERNLDDMEDLFLEYTKDKPQFADEREKAMYFMSYYLKNKDSTVVVYCNNEDMESVRADNVMRIKKECGAYGASSQCMILATNDVSKLNVLLLDANGYGHTSASIEPVKSFFIVTECKRSSYLF